jgi:site-specific recombinase XerD
VRRAAWGFTIQQDGRQVRCFREDWSKEEAEMALAGSAVHSHMLRLSFASRLREAGCRWS